MSWLPIDEVDDLLEIGLVSMEFHDMELLVEAKDTLCSRNAIRAGS